jgi:hypothetical protein
MSGQKAFTLWKNSFGLNPKANLSASWRYNSFQFVVGVS